MIPSSPRRSFNFLSFLTLSFVCFFSFTVLAEDAYLPPGEIININRQYRIFFVDLGDQYLDVGNVVNVETKDGTKVLLKVVEALPVISKLEPLDKNSKDFEKISVGDSLVRTEAVESIESFTGNKGLLKQEEFTSETVIRNTDGTIATDLLENHVKEFNNKYLELSKRYAELEQQNKDFSMERVSLEKEIDRLNKELKSTSDLMDQVKQSNDELKGRLSSLSSNNEVHNQEITICKEKIDRLKGTVVVLREKLKYVNDLINQNIQSHE